MKRTLCFAVSALGPRGSVASVKGARREASVQGARHALWGVEGSGVRVQGARKEASVQGAR